MMHNLAVTEEEIGYSLKANGDWNPVHHDKNAARKFLEVMNKESNGKIAVEENVVITPGILYLRKIINLPDFKGKDVNLLNININSPLAVNEKKEIIANVNWDDKKEVYIVELIKKEKFNGQEIDNIFLNAKVGIKKEDLNEKVRSLENSINADEGGLIIKDKINISKESLGYYLKSISLSEESHHKEYGVFVSTFVPPLLLKLSDKLESKEKEGVYFFKNQNLILGENKEGYKISDVPLKIFGKLKSRLSKNVELCFSYLAIVDPKGKPIVYSSNITGKMLK